MLLPRQFRFSMLSFKKVHLLYFYLMSVLRLRVPTPTNLQREVPKEGMMIDGHFIPGGVQTFLDILLTSDNREHTNIHNNAR